MWNEFGRYTAGLAVAAVMRAACSARIALLVASLAGRRAVAAAMIVGVFIVTTPVSACCGASRSRSNGRSDRAAPRSAVTSSGSLASPLSDRRGLGRLAVRRRRTGPSGRTGRCSTAVALAVTVVLCLLLLLRYRKVAR